MMWTAIGDYCLLRLMSMMCRGGCRNAPGLRALVTLTVMCWDTSQVCALPCILTLHLLVDIREITLLAVSRPKKTCLLATISAPLLLWDVLSPCANLVVAKLHRIHTVQPVDCWHAARVRYRQARQVGDTPICAAVPAAGLCLGHRAIVFCFL